MTDETDDLAARQFTPTSGQAAQAADQAQAAAAERADRDGQLLFVLEKGTVLLVVGLLKAIRTRIATRMPEILDHWTDEVLAGPGEALAPVLKRYGGTLAALMGEHSELAGLAFSLVPLGMGYMAASEAHARNEGRTIEAAPAAAAAAKLD